MRPPPSSPHVGLAGARSANRTLTRFEFIIAQVGQRNSDTLCACARAFSFEYANMRAPMFRLHESRTHKVVDVFRPVCPVYFGQHTHAHADDANPSACVAPPVRANAQMSSPRSHTRGDDFFLIACQLVTVRARASRGYVATKIIYTTRLPNSITWPTENAAAASASSSRPPQPPDASALRCGV